MNGLRRRVNVEKMRRVRADVAVRLGEINVRRADAENDPNLMPRTMDQWMRYLKIARPRAYEVTAQLIEEPLYDNDPVVRVRFTWKERDRDERAAEPVR